MSLDAKVRQKFQNDPEAFLAFATDASNIDEMVKLGLATKTEIQPVKIDPVVKEEASK